MMLNPVRGTAAATAAIEQAIAVLRKALGAKSSMLPPPGEDVSLALIE